MNIIKGKIYNFFKKKVSETQSKIDIQIPKYDLQEKHISNVKLLPNRSSLLEFLPKNGKVAELGVNKGDFSLEILQINSPKELILIDVWSSKRYHGGLREIVETRLKEFIQNRVVNIHQGYSTALSNKFADGDFDWIYIDTDHSYTVTKAELQAYKSKIKPGGFIAGHDYIQGNWNETLRYGVMEAVHEFCVKEDWELVFLTTELSNSPSFAIRKILP